MVLVRIRWFLALVSLLALAGGCGGEGVEIGVGFEETEDAPELLQGQVVLENMSEHSDIRIELMEIDLSLLTDSEGEYALPNEIADGEWTLHASYPYFTAAKQNFVVETGIPTSDLEQMELIQEVAFEVIPEKTFYTYGETVMITLNVYNLVDYPVTLSSTTSPMTAYAVQFKGQTVVGGLFPGQGVEPQSITLEVGQVESFVLNWTIDNHDLKPGEYKIFAVLTVSATYADYFSQDAELAEELNKSLFHKLTPATIVLQ